MKKIVSIFFIVSLLFSCTNDNEVENSTGFLEVFELVKMTGSFGGSETTGSDMEWQESYRLNTQDSTFIKLRLFNQDIFEATGTYTYKIIEGQDFIEFSYYEDASIISNCAGDLKEVLLILEDGQKLKGTWGACDGPGLEYRRGMEFCGTEL